MEQEKKSKKNNRVLVLLRKFFFLGFSFVFLFFLASYLIIQNPKFQNWAVPKVTKILEDKTGVKVSISHVDIDFNRYVNMHDLLLHDLKGDTLLYVNNFKADLGLGLTSLFGRQLKVGNVVFENGILINKRGTEKHFLNSILLLIKGDPTKKKKLPLASKKKKKKKTFILDIDKVFLNNFVYFEDDSIKGQRTYVDINWGEIEVDKIDFALKTWSFCNAKFDNPRLKIVNYPRDEDLYNEWWYRDHPKMDESIDDEVWFSDFGDDTQVEKKKESSVSPPKETYPQLKIKCDYIDVNNLAFFYQNERYGAVDTTFGPEINYTNLGFEDINGSVSNFIYDQAVFGYFGSLHDLSFHEKTGLKMESWSVDDFWISDHGGYFNGLYMKTENSLLTNFLGFDFKSFADFSEFNDKVKIDASFSNANIAIKDILHFAPKLKNTKFFNDNLKEEIFLDGKVFGKVNGLKADDLKMNIGGVRMHGNFRTRNLAVRHEELLFVELKELDTDIHTLRSLVPTFNPPENFNKLGHLNFKGRFDGFFNNFVANGTLSSEVGVAKMEMQLVENETTGIPNYFGEMQLVDFDMGYWVSNPDFGKFNFKTKVKNGVGLTLDKLSADLVSQIENFYYKGYTYQNLDFEGHFEKNLIDGLVEIKDENLNFTFDGSIDFKDKDPVFNFKANINKFNIQQLKISDRNLDFSGDFNCNFKKKKRKYDGNIFVTNFEIIENGNTSYKLDSLLLVSELNSQDSTLNSFQVKSDIIDGKLQGIFDLKEIGFVFQDYIMGQNPVLWNNLGLSLPETVINPYNLDFDIQVRNTLNFTRLLDPKLDTLKDVYFSGSINNFQDSIFVDLLIPRLNYDKVSIEDLYFLSIGGKEQQKVDIGYVDLNVNNKKLGSGNVELLIFDDLVDFDIRSSNVSAYLPNLRLGGKLRMKDKFVYTVNLNKNDIFLLEESWSLPENNYIQIKKGEIKLNNLVFNSGSKEISFRSIGGVGMEAEWIGFPLDFINDLWKEPRLDFGGSSTLSISMENYSKLENLKVAIRSDKILINNDDWGEISFKTKIATLKRPFSVRLDWTGEEHNVGVSGSYFPKNENALSTYANNSLELKVKVEKFPIDFIEYIIPEGISNVDGYITSNAYFQGPVKKLVASGTIHAYKGNVKVDYLGVEYHFDDQTVELKENFIDFTGAVIHDKYNNDAKIIGGLTHNYFKNLGVNLDMITHKFLGLDTKEIDNELFYGHIIGNGKISFKGPIASPFIKTDISCGENSNLTIPMYSTGDISTSDFVRFEVKDLNHESEQVESKISSGISLEMNVQLEEEAEGIIIIDKQAGDNIRTNGTGNVTLKIDREGGFEMVGEYIINRGEYLFTFLNTVNKKFRIRDGGKLEWTGDPFDASIDIVADYNEIKVSPYPLIYEFENLLGDNKNIMHELTDLELIMNLKGLLMKPDIDFDLNFPRLNHELISVVDQKVRLIKENQNELNKQVLGVLVVGSFLTPDIDLLGSGALAGTSTLSQFVTNQLSDLINASLSDDISFNMNYYNASNTGADFYLSDELNLYSKVKINDKLSVSGEIGLGFGQKFGDLTSSGLFNNGDLDFEYSLTDRIILRGYNHYEREIRGIENKVGGGLKFRRSFDYWKELFDKVEE